MLTDDDFPDYFVDDNDDTDADNDSAPRRNPDEPVHAGDTISFSDDTSSRSDGSGNAPRHTSRILGPLALFVVVAAVLIAYFRYLSPCVDDAVMDVYITKVEKRGVLFKTFEAEVVDPAKVDDPSSAGTYTHPVSVSIAADSVARAMTALQGSGRKVRLHYRRFYGTVPWRGESKIVITALDR